MSGWSAALKPAYEPILLARKPLACPTLAANVRKWGTGALNIERCRVGVAKNVPASPRKSKGAGYSGFGAPDGNSTGFNPYTGRWPANIVLDEAAAAQLDAQSGGSVSPKTVTRGAHRKGFFNMAPQADMPCPGDSGGASRFLFCAKASQAERHAALADKANNHPTVKPQSLMKWLLCLVVPPGHAVIDPFAGSGSTLLAAASLNIPWVGVELSAEYADLARRRVAAEAAQGKLF